MNLLKVLLFDFFLQIRIMQTYAIAINLFIKKKLECNSVNKWSSNISLHYQDIIIKLIYFENYCFFENVLFYQIGLYKNMCINKYKLLPIYTIYFVCCLVKKFKWFHWCLIYTKPLVLYREDPIIKIHFV